MWKSNLFHPLFFFGPKTAYPKCKPVILVFKSKKKWHCIYFTISSEVEVSLSKNTFYSILLCFLYKLKLGYMQNILIFPKQEHIFSVLGWQLKENYGKSYEDD